jgi:hypothetical protein
MGSWTSILMISALLPNDNQSNASRQSVSYSPILVITLLLSLQATGMLEHTAMYFSLFTGSTAPLGPGLCFQFHDHFTDGRTPWTSDHLVARPLPKHRTTQTQNKHIHIPNIHALCGIRTHDPGFRASEDSTCLRLFGYSDRRNVFLMLGKMLAKNQFSPTEIRNNKQKWEHSACSFVAVVQGCQKPAA